MLAMIRALVPLAACLLASISLRASEKKQPTYPSFDYDAAVSHEVQPHRRTIPFEGILSGGFHQLRLTLIVSPTGDVLHAEASGDGDDMDVWPKLQEEVAQWKFTPFEHNGKPVTAEVKEYIDLVPPERLPTKHVAAPVLRSDSKSTITLARTGCFGSCPAYTLSLSTDGIVFDGKYNVVATGKHTDTVSPDEVRDLVRRFVTADFYSMDDEYRADVTDNPTYMLSIAIDGHEKRVEDYVGSWVGMPAVITALEGEVDALARTQRWIEGSDGLVAGLQAEHFNFHTFDAQVMLKQCAARGQVATVRELLEAGVPLMPIPVPKRKDSSDSVPFVEAGWLTSASSHPDVLQLLIDAGASENDQKDKDVALAGAAQSGHVEAARTLIAYGANPNVDLSKLAVTQSGGGMTLWGPGAGSVLIEAAESGNPEMVREILRYSPKLELREREGKTAMFAAGDYRDSDKEGARVECVRMLAAAGANVNARDNDGNTPLHETFLTDVEEELLKLGANVNARNNDGETPIFTTVDDKAIPLFIEQGADLTLRNNKGQTVVEAAKGKGPLRQETLRKAIQKLNQR
jgi:ankyrin repeat protein